MNKKIELTRQEIEDLKDEVKFRTTVLIELKQLRGIPNKVTKLEISTGFLWAFISTIILGFLGKIVWAAMTK